LILLVCLAQATAVAPAQSVASEEVVIRARPREEQTYRIRPLAGAERFEAARAGLPAVEVAAFGGTLSAEADSGALARGQTSKRAMIRFKRRF
jgi:hypothetical protein